MVMLSVSKWFNNQIYFLPKWDNNFILKTNIKLFNIGKCWVVFLSFLTHGEDVPHEKWSFLEHRMLSSLCLSNFYFQRRGHLMCMVVLCNYNKSKNDNELLGWLPQSFSFFSLIFSRPLRISNFFLSYLSFFCCFAFISFKLLLPP